jgi:hypothetical protein
LTKYSLQFKLHIELRGQLKMFRCDRAEFQASLTPEGYLAGEAIATRTGVFEYVNADGTIRKELRHPDDILENESLATLKLKPVTDNHPSVLVNADNAGVYQVGTTGETVRVDGGNIAVSFVVTDKATVEKIKANKKRELSLGYTLDLVEEAGVFNGDSYTHRQTNVRYNHLAIVQKARAGRLARINMDGVAVQLHHNDKEDDSMTEKEMQTVNLDGLTYRADAEVAKAFEKALKGEKQARLDSESLKGQVDELKAQLEAVKATHNDEAMAQAVAERVVLLETAKRVVNVDALQGSSDRLIKETVIKAKHEAINLDGKSDDYVNARFDALIEALPSVEDEAVAKQKQAVASVHRDTAVSTDMRSLINKKFHGGAK